MTTESLTKKIQPYLEQLKKMHDEIHLDIHLAGMETRQRWEELQKKVFELERTAMRASDATVQAAEELVKKVRDFQANYKAKRPNANP